MNTKTLGIVLAVAILVGMVGYFVLVKKPDLTTQPTTSTSTQEAVTQQPTKTEITILVPSDVAAYEKAMTAYVQEGGQDPSKTWTFVKKTLSVPYTNDVIKASAQAAAEQLTPYGGPAKASVAYLKVKEGIAYVLLDIDLDGWAGVSVSLGKIHPLVEKTLLQFSQIKSVAFRFAPGDNLQNTSKVPASTQIQSDETAGWKTYYDPEKRFSFRYPVEYRVALSPVKSVGNNLVEGLQSKEPRTLPDFSIFFWPNTLAVLKKTPSLTPSSASAYIKCGEASVITVGVEKISALRFTCSFDGQSWVAYSLQFNDTHVLQFQFGPQQITNIPDFIVNSVQLVKFTVSPASGKAPLTVTTASFDGCNSELTWGDGRDPWYSGYAMQSCGAGVPTHPMITKTHTYTAPGTYTISLYLNPPPAKPVSTATVTVTQTTSGSGPTGILLPSDCKIVGSMSKGDVYPDVTGPNGEALVLGGNEWSIDCGSNNGNARGTLGPVLKKQGWAECDFGLSTATWWKDGIATVIAEGSSGSAFPLELIQTPNTRGTPGNACQ